MNIFMTATMAALFFVVGGLIGGSLNFVGTPAGSFFNPWVGVVGTLLGTLLGAGISELSRWREKESDRVGHFEALAAEISMVNAMANGYLKQDVISPLYRYPVIAFDRSLHPVLTKHVVDKDDSNALLNFYVNVQAMNRSLDNVHAFIVEGKKLPAESDARWNKLFEREVKRCRLKAKHFSDVHGDGNIYKKAAAAVAKHLPPNTLQHLAFSMQDEDLLG